MFELLTLFLPMDLCYYTNWNPHLQGLLELHTFNPETSAIMTTEIRSIS